MTSITVIAAVALFNLVCSGTHSSGKIFDRAVPETPKKMVLRVDLDGRRWCTGPCLTTSRISEVTENQVTLSESRNGPRSQKFSIDRETGEFVDVWIDWNADWRILDAGFCVKSEFTGFPARKF